MCPMEVLLLEFPLTYANIGAVYIGVLFDEVLVIKYSCKVMVWCSHFHV